MQIAADKKTAVLALVLSLMFIRCDNGDLGMTTPWGLRAQDVEQATDAVTGFTASAQEKINGFVGPESKGD